ncbi:MAG: 30S ribosomal protein S8 [Alphaproteobacteria bacterium]|nr:30S ribosomal protein S8 [Alphaproteobacteria bacterium]
MNLTDPLGDMLTRIRNAQMRSRATVMTPGSKLRGRVLDVLVDEGYIRGYSVSEMDNGTTEYDVELKYSDGRPVIREIQRVSKPGRRVYASVKNIPSISNGLGVAILSTSKGVMADHRARSESVGGEILCRVF